MYFRGIKFLMTDTVNLRIDETSDTNGNDALNVKSVGSVTLRKFGILRMYGINTLSICTLCLSVNLARGSLRPPLH